MMYGTIARIVQTDDLRYVTARTAGGEEPEVALVVPVGVHYEPKEGDPLLIFVMDSTVGEFAAWPGRFLPPSPTTDRVALQRDTDALNTRMDELEANLQEHGHFVPLPGGPTAGTPTSPAAMFPIPTDITPPGALIPVPSTEATLVGSDRLLATYEEP